MRTRKLNCSAQPSASCGWVCLWRREKPSCCGDRGDIVVRLPFLMVTSLPNAAFDWLTLLCKCLEPLFLYILLPRSLAPWKESFFLNWAVDFLKVLKSISLEIGYLFVFYKLYHLTLTCESFTTSFPMGWTNVVSTHKTQISRNVKFNDKTLSLGDSLKSIRSDWHKLMFVPIRLFPKSYNASGKYSECFTCYTFCHVI